MRTMFGKIDKKLARTNLAPGQTWPITNFAFLTTLHIFSISRKAMQDGVTATPFLCDQSGQIGEIVSLDETGA